MENEPSAIETPQATPEAAEICDRFVPSEQASELLRPQMHAGVYLGLLVERELFDDALQCVAHTLPPREAVWWGCLCAWDVIREQPTEEPTSAAIHAAVQWVLDPTEENRRQAEIEGRYAGLGAPAGSLAMAAFWSGGSMSRPGLPEVAPEPFLYARVVAKAVRSAAKKLGRKQADTLTRRFIGLGMDVAAGKLHWTKEEIPAIGS